MRQIRNLVARGVPDYLANCKCPTLGEFGQLNSIRDLDLDFENTEEMLVSKRHVEVWKLRDKHGSSIECGLNSAYDYMPTMPAPIRF